MIAKRKFHLVRKSKNLMCFPVLETFHLNARVNTLPERSCTGWDGCVEGGFLGIGVEEYIQLKKPTHHHRLIP